MFLKTMKMTKRPVSDVIRAWWPAILLAHGFCNALYVFGRYAPQNSLNLLEAESSLPLSDKTNIQLFQEA